MDQQFSDNFTRPNDTTPYTAADLVANSTTAGSVVPMQFPVGEYMPERGGRVKSAIMAKSGDTVTAASFTLHLFSSEPTVDAGDNAAFAPSSVDNWIGSIALDISSGALVVTGLGARELIAASPEVVFHNSVGVLFGLLVAAGAYTPAANEVFTVTLNIERE
jgi:hypothetical protein